MSEAADPSENLAVVSAETGKGRERLEVRSGQIAIIDQFMLANQQFLSKLHSPQYTPADVLHMYGGCIVKAPPGEYVVYRNPEQTLILLIPQHLLQQRDQLEEDTAQLIAEDVLRDRSEFVAQGRVYVDTRCVVIIDQQSLHDSELLGTFARLRRTQKDKEARDLLREHGAAVRYGFNRYGDELGVFQIPNKELIALWPDVIG